MQGQMPDPAAPGGQSMSGQMSSGTPGGQMSTDTASPPEATMNKTYPVCSRTVRDECRNRGGV